MATKKKISNDKIIVVGISVMAMVLIIGFIIKELGVGKSEVKVTDDVVVSETGEASSINFTVPSNRAKTEDAQGLIGTYEKRRTDSLRTLRESKDINLKEISNGGDGVPSFNDKLYSRQDDEFLKNVERQLQEMEANGSTRGSSGTNVKSTVNTEVQQEMEYRDMLLKAREQREQRSSDYSGGLEIGAGKGSYNDAELSDIEDVEFRVAIYHDQLILPGERVTLILTDDLEYRGNIFPKNTILYAMASVNKNRVLLDVANINHVNVDLVARDVDDGLVGLYNTKAGALWDRYEKEMVNNAKGEGLREAARSVPGNVGRIASSVARSMGSFFRKKGVSNKDKILLVNDDQLILTTQGDG